MSETVAQNAQQQLCAKLHARDSAAFCELYDSTVSYVYKLARCVADEPSWAECVTESVFQAVWRSPETISPAHGSVHEALGQLVEQLSTIRIDEASGVGAPQRARIALRSLSAGERDAVHAVYFGGQSMPAAAASLGTTVIDVARNLRAGMRRLTEAQLPTPRDQTAPGVA